MRIYADRGVTLQRCVVGEADARSASNRAKPGGSPKCWMSRSSSLPFIAFIRVHSRSFFGAVDITATLMKDEVGDLALIVFEKLDLCVHDFVKEFCF
jgi:hypothetical protein